MRVENNTAAFNIWSGYRKNISRMKKSMTRLSTGRILPMDDPAGAGISERMLATAGGIENARHNVDTAISLMQTSDGWYQKIDDMLSRMKELSVQANGVLSGQDKENIATEFKSIQREITRITSKSTAAAKFNGIYLTRGGTGIPADTGDNIVSGDVDVQIGDESDQTVEIDLHDLDVANDEVIGTVHTYSYDEQYNLTASTHEEVKWSEIINDTSGINVDASDATGKIDAAISYLSNLRADMASQQRRMENTRESLLSYESNIRESESKIRDIDMARESSSFTKYMILSNVSNAMLAQANNMPSSVLNLFFS